MHKAFIFSILALVLVVSMFALAEIFSTRQLRLQDDTTVMLGGLKIIHIWDDVAEGITNIFQVLITVQQNEIILDDELPAQFDLTGFLANYGQFIDQFYATPDLSINFLSPDGTEISPADLSPDLTISPFNIKYGYPDFGKNEMHITSPLNNISIISSISINLTLTNAILSDDSINWTPYQSCAASTCIHLNLAISDGSTTLSSIQTDFDSSKQSQTTISCQIGGSGDCYVKILVGQSGGADPQNVVDVKLHNANVTSAASLLLNTTEFSVDLLAKLQVEDINLGIQKTDWI